MQIEVNKSVQSSALIQLSRHLNKLVQCQHSDKVLRHILVCSSPPLVLSKLSDKQTNVTLLELLKLNWMWEAGTSVAALTDGAGVNLQQAARVWDDNEELSVGCGHLLTYISTSWNNTSNSTHNLLFYLGTFENLAQKLKCLLHKLKDTAITFPHVSSFIYY